MDAKEFGLERENACLKKECTKKQNNLSTQLNNKIEDLKSNIMKFYFLSFNDRKEKRKIGLTEVGNQLILKMTE